MIEVGDLVFVKELNFIGKVVHIFDNRLFYVDFPSEKGLRSYSENEIQLICKAKDRQDKQGEIGKMVIEGRVSFGTMIYSIDELLELIERTRHHQTRANIINLMKEEDQDGIGKITYQDLGKTLNKYKGKNVRVTIEPL